MGTIKGGFVWIHSHSYVTLPEEAIDECSGFLVPSQYRIKTTTTERTSLRHLLALQRLLYLAN